MSSGFKLEPREGYLYVQLEPYFELTADNTTRMWVTISDTCRANGLRKVLVEGDHATRRMTPMEVFDIAGLLSRLLPGLSVAFCLRGYVPDDQTLFFQTAAMNRGVRSEFFHDLNAALQWLGAAPRSMD